MTSVVAPAVTPRARRAWSIVFLLVLSGWMAGLQLAQPALLDPDEPRSALVARLMAERGDWLSPHLPATLSHEYPHDPIEGDLLAYWDKPPLYFWMAATAMKVLGPTALAARLPAALAYVAMVLLVFAAGRFLAGTKAGFLAGIVMGLAPLPLAMAHVARMDMVLAALMTVMLLAIIRLVQGAPRAWFWVIVLYGAGGLGILTKGPEAVVFPAAAVLVTVMLTGRWRDLLRLRPLEGALIVAAIAVPWFAYMHLRYPGDASSGGYLYEFLIRQHFTRATGTEYEHTRFVPGLLLAIFLGGFLPWTVFLPAAAGGLGREAWGERRQRPALLLILVWPVLVLGVFSLSKTQLAHYILPMFPAVAILVGLYLARRLEPGDDGALRRVARTASITAAGVILIAAAVYFVFNRVYLEQYRGYGPIVVSLVYWIGAVLAAGSVILTDMSLAWRHRAVALWCLAAVVALGASVVLVTDPARLNRISSTYHHIMVTRETSRLPGDAILAYPHQPYSFAWYTWGQPVVVLPPESPDNDVPTRESLVAELNKPRRTFCILQKRSMVDELRPLVRGEITLLSDARDRYTFIMTTPPKEALPHDSK